MKKIHLKRKKTIEDRITDEVDKEVKEMKREWRHFVKFRDENYLLFIAFVILVAAGVIINTSYVINHTSSARATSKNSKTIVVPYPTKRLTSQQTGTNSAQTVKISNVTENDKKDYAYSLDSTETMLIMDISVTNNTLQTQQLIPVNQLYVRTEEGDNAAMHASMYVTKPLDATELAPGKTATGQISFAVPKHIAHPLLYVDTGWDKSVPLVYDVLK